MKSTVVLSTDEVRELAADVLTTAGLADDHVQAIADSVTAAERDGATAHGLFRLPTYVEGVHSGRVNPHAQPVLSELKPSVIHVDADEGFAQLALQVGMKDLTERARGQGIAALAVTRCYSLSALWHEVEQLARQGLVSLTMTTSKANVAPAGGHQPLFGTDPMAFGWPRAGGGALVYDQASSVTARGEIALRAQRGEEIPEGWALDPHGNPTTDPAQALAGAQLPFGGYKGASIAMMIELLAGPMLGEPLSVESFERDGDRSPLSLRGQLMMAMDPLGFIADGDRAAQLEHAEKLFSRILAQEGTRLPADRRLEARARSESEGITLELEQLERLRALTHRQ